MSDQLNENSGGEIQHGCFFFLSTPGDSSMQSSSTTLTNSLFTDLLNEGLSTLETPLTGDLLNLGANHYLGANQPSTPY